MIPTMSALDEADYVYLRGCGKRTRFPRKRSTTRTGKVITRQSLFLNRMNHLSPMNGWLSPDYDT